MTITAIDATLYAGALLILFLTPGPVWVALTATGKLNRSMASFA